MEGSYRARARYTDQVTGTGTDGPWRGPGPGEDGAAGNDRPWRCPPGPGPVHRPGLPGTGTGGPRKGNGPGDTRATVIQDRTVRS